MSYNNNNSTRHYSHIYDRTELGFQSLRLTIHEKEDTLQERRDVTCTVLAVAFSSNLTQTLVATVSVVTRTVGLITVCRAQLTFIYVYNKYTAI